MDKSPPPESEIEKLKRRIEQLERENSELKTRLNRARDPNPVKRPSRRRVHLLLGDAGMDLFRKGKQWLVKFGKAEQYYRSLNEIWKVITKESWDLSELFPYPSNSDTPPPEPQKRKPANLPRKPKRNLSLFQLDLKQRLENVGREVVKARGEPQIHFMESML